MPKARSLLLVKLLDGDDEHSGTMLHAVPLGTFREVVEAFAAYNTGPDGDPESSNLLYGPGIRVELPFVDARDPVQQVVVSLTEEDIAWSVLERICRGLKWKMMDPGTGRTFG
ncbi:MAG: hypothetical protein IBJ11_08740 [Phycisphaerales bacterium]|nr:hypothetical protein [Phycisphaerales bacterium]